MFDPVPPDIAIQRQVEEAIEAGHPLPRWGWKTPEGYMGATGAERILGWQKIRIAETLCLLPSRGRCSGCGAVAEHRHTEIYQRPLFSPGVCRSCHFHIHRRFARPDRWQGFLEERVEPQSWFRSFSLAPITRELAMQIAAEADLVRALSRLGAGQR